MFAFAYTWDRCGTAMELREEFSPYQWQQYAETGIVQSDYHTPTLAQQMEWKIVYTSIQETSHMGVFKHGNRNISVRDWLCWGRLFSDKL